MSKTKVISHSYKLTLYELFEKLNDADFFVCPDCKPNTSACGDRIPRDAALQFHSGDAIVEVTWDEK